MCDTALKSLKFLSWCHGMVFQMKACNVTSHPGPATQTRESILNWNGINKCLISQTSLTCTPQNQVGLMGNHFVCLSHWKVLLFWLVLHHNCERCSWFIKCLKGHGLPALLGSAQLSEPTSEREGEWTENGEKERVSGLVINFHFLRLIIPASNEISEREINLLPVAEHLMSRNSDCAAHHYSAYCL